MSRSFKRILFFVTVLLLNLPLVKAQTKVSGTVTLQDGTPGTGVTIVVKGSTVAMVADLDGNFNLSVPEGFNILEFSYVGYIKTEVDITNQTVVNVTLEEELLEISEVVVVGYGTQKKSDLTGSIAMVSTKDMKNRSIQSADQALQGKAAGVLVTNNGGAPGTSISVKVRGTGSFGNTDPLYIVDGVPIKDASFGKNDNPTGINFLNPNDIESIQVLKDASSAAIYGTRGANGVVIITTKRGQSKKIKVDIENYVGVQTMPKKLEMLNAQQFATLWNEVKPSALFDSTEIPSLQTTDWVDGVTSKALVYNNQVSISKGDDKKSFYLSFNNFYQDGIIQSSGYDRQSVRINSDIMLFKRLKIGESLTLMQSNRDRIDNSGVLLLALGSDPTQKMYNDTGNWTDLNARTGGNPRRLVDQNHYNFVSKRLQGNLYAELELIKNLEIQIKYRVRSYG